MEKNFYNFAEVKISQFFQAVSNIFIFLPYYFSVLQLLKTLFKPWKNLILKKTKAGFSFNEVFSRLSFNLISSSIGLMMRVIVLTTYIIFQILFIALIPLVLLLFLISLPFNYFFSRLGKTKEEEKNIIKREFLENHLLKEENRPRVEQWFEIYYRSKINKSPWWRSANLFSIPPLARDWSMGYTPALDQFGEELTQEASHFKNLVNREKEIQQIEQALTKLKEANVIIVGEEGVGKHTIVEGLAKKIYEGKTNSLLAYKRIIKIDIEKIISQGIDINQKEEVLKAIFLEAAEARNIIILIDNFDKFIASGADRTDLTTIISQFAKTDKLQFIGITTLFFYQKFVFVNERICRLFEKVEVFEIDEKEAEEILLKTAFDFEQRFKVVIPFETIKEVVEKSSFYITHIPFPEKAIELLDEACVYVTQSVRDVRDRPLLVTPEIVDTVLSQKTHIPIRLDETLKTKLLNLEKLLEEKIVFQKEGIEKLSSALRKSFVMANKRKKPLASFLFLGPTGVGKTETAKALASVFFGSEAYLLRFDMSFYQRKDDIPNLLGSMDTGNPGLLTKTIREKPYGVLLLDEIEKADPQLLNIFLTLLDEGYFTDGFGKRVDCKNLIVITTSNATEPPRLDTINNDRTSEVKSIDWLIQNHIFTPEFLNRFDGIITYHVLTKQATYEIAKKMLAKIIEEVYKIHQVRVNISENFLNNLVEKGYNPKFGARNLERVITDEVEDKVAKLILEGNIKEGEILDL